jgi:N-acyl-D-aspartate/D-glutamate deacylase
MLDLLLRGGDVVDGTGASRRRADVGIRDGRIVALGDVDEQAAETIDADGLVVAPGFVDVHTHYDAQLLWDGAATPSPLHGVTTVLGGNCGFTIAPLTERDVDYVMRMMARVEGMPLDALQHGASWDWHGFGEYLSRLDGRVAVNAGFLAGHSTIRRVAMGDRAVGEAATADDVDAMARLLDAALVDGALGLSSSLAPTHTDGDNRPVPSRAASRDELLALAGTVRGHDGTTLEFIPTVGEFTPELIELMTDMSLTADRPLNWNLLGSLSPTEVYQGQLEASDHARARGAYVVALTLPDLMRLRTGSVMDSLPGWRDVVALGPEERRRAVADPEVRARLRDGVAAARERGLGAFADWNLVEVADADSLEHGALVGRTIADIAAERGGDPVDVLIDVVLPERLPLTLVLPSLVPSLGATDAGWARRAEVWRDDRTVLGGSDAGAHLDVMCHANYTTSVLGDAVRHRGLLELEEAVRQFTDVPARLYGLRGRGRIAEGWCADVVVFDPARIATRPVRARHDLPGGGMRLYAESEGVEHVLVNGTEIVRAGALTDTRPGTVLRSGRDTDTVTVPGAS